MPFRGLIAFVVGIAFLYGVAYNTGMLLVRERMGGQHCLS